MEGSSKTMAAQMIGPVQGDQLISVQKNSEISLLSEVSALNSLSKDFLSRYAELLQPLATSVAELYPGWRMRIYHNVTQDVR